MVLRKIREVPDGEGDEWASLPEQEKGEEQGNEMPAINQAGVL